MFTALFDGKSLNVYCFSNVFYKKKPSFFFVTLRTYSCAFKYVFEYLSWSTKSYRSLIF